MIVVGGIKKGGCVQIEEVRLVFRLFYIGWGLLQAVCSKTLELEERRTRLAEWRQRPEALPNRGACIPEPLSVSKRLYSVGFEKSQMWIYARYLISCPPVKFEKQPQMAMSKFGPPDIERIIVYDTEYLPGEMFLYRRCL